MYNAMNVTCHEMIKCNLSMNMLNCMVMNNIFKVFYFRNDVLAIHKLCKTGSSETLKI